MQVAGFGQPPSPSFGCLLMIGLLLQVWVFNGFQTVSATSPQPFNNNTQASSDHSPLPSGSSVLFFGSGFTGYLSAPINLLAALSHSASLWFWLPGPAPVVGFWSATRSLVLAAIPCLFFSPKIRELILPLVCVHVFRALWVLCLGSVGFWLSSSLVSFGLVLAVVACVMAPEFAGCKLSASFDKVDGALNRAGKYSQVEGRCFIVPVWTFCFLLFAQRFDEFSIGPLLPPLACSRPQLHILSIRTSLETCHFTLVWGWGVVCCLQ